MTRLRSPFVAIITLVSWALAAPLPAQDQSIKADPPGQAPPAITDKLNDLAAPESFFGPEVSFADQFGPYVIVGRNADPKESRVVYDLTTGMQVATLKGKIEFLDKPCALSPDGKLYACAGGFRKEPSITLLELTSGQTQELAMPMKPDHLEFLGPDRLLTVAGFDTIITVFDTKTGKALKTFRTSHRQAMPAVSPGGNYVAVVEDQRLNLYNLKTGDKAQTINIPKPQPFGYRCEALAFAPDGAMIGGLFKKANQWAVLAWKVDGGAPVVEEVLELKQPFFDGKRLQWSPDGSAWLVNGEVIVDSQSGKVLWKLEPPLHGNCRIVAANQVLGLVDKRDGPMLSRSISAHHVVKEQLTKMTQLARSGGHAADALLPQLTEVDLSAVRRIDVPLGGAALSYKPDAAEDASKLAARPALLGCRGKEIQSIHFTSPAAAQVAIELTTLEHNPFQPPPRATAIERYDLTTGRKVSRWDLPFPARLAAAAPDGKHLLLVEADQAGRLDLWNLEETAPKHVVGWRPYAKEGDEKNRKVTFAAVAQGDRVLTSNAAGKLICWSLPAGKAEWVIETAPLTGLRLTPGGKYLVGLDRDIVRIFDIATGAPAGDLSPSAPFPAGRKEARAVAVRSDGKELAALWAIWPEDNTGPVGALARWDLTSGKWLESGSFRSRLFAGTAAVLSYAGNEHLLIDNTVLFDLGRKELVWTYALAGIHGKHAAYAPDDRHWYAAADFDGPATLVAAALPEAGIDQYVKLVETGEAIVKPGKSIAVRVELKGDQADRVKETVADNARKGLLAAGFRPADNADVVLTLSGSERDSGKSVEFRELFSGPGSNPFARTRVQLMEINCQAELSSGGTVVWRSGWEQQNMRTIGIVTLPKGEKDVGRFLRTRMWDGVSNWALRAALPRHIVRTSEGVFALPGSSSFRADGPAPQPPRVEPGK
jgi:WD40 repeat protein